MLLPSDMGSCTTAALLQARDSLVLRLLPSCFSSTLCKKTGEEPGMRLARDFKLLVHIFAELQFNQLDLILANRSGN